MDIQNLIDSGYKEFRNNWKAEGTVSLQKRFRNEKGTKYFVNIYYYKNEKFGDSYEVELQFNKTFRNQDYTMDITIFSFGKYNQKTEKNDYNGINISDIEEFIEDIWLKNEFKYYEKY